MGTNADPYQRAEGRYQLMRGILEALRDFAQPVLDPDQGPLLLRDLDLLVEVARGHRVSACLSIPTLDEKVWRATEPRTPHPRARIEAVAELNRGRIPTGVLIAPLMPGINDAPRAGRARSSSWPTRPARRRIGGIALHLRGEVREIFFDWLRERPDLLPRYERAVRARRAPPEVRRREIERAAGLRRTRLPSERGHRLPGGARLDPSPPPERGVRQEALF